MVGATKHTEKTKVQLGLRYDSPRVYVRRHQGRQRLGAPPVRWGRADNKPDVRSPRGRSINHPDDRHDRHDWHGQRVGRLGYE